MLATAPAAIALGIAGVAKEIDLGFVVPDMRGKIPLLDNPEKLLQWTGSVEPSSTTVADVLVEKEEATYRHYSGYETLDVPIGLIKP